MSRSTFTRRAVLATTLTLLGGLVTACADAPGTAPVTAEATLAPREVTSRATLLGTAGDTTLHQFTYAPSTALTERIGAHEIRFPAGAVCDPATSGYGPGTWDAPCTPLAAPITFTVRTWTDAAGHPRVRFSPDVRFVPTQTVTLYLYDKATALDKKFQAFWCPTGSRICINESLADPTLKAWVDWEHNTVYRRVKHFSGYMIQAGYTSGLGGFSDEGI